MSGKRRVNVAYTIGKTSESRAISVEFTEDEWKRLNLFLRNVDELKSSGLRDADLRCSVEMKLAEQGPQHWEVLLPDRGVLVLLLHQLRPLILQRDEHANFDKRQS